MFFEREKGFGITTDKKDKGYSRWAKEKEIKEELECVQITQKNSKAAGIPIILNDKEMWVDNGEYHSLVIGATGSGKTQTVILPMVYNLAKATLKTIEQNDNVGMFSICFDGSEVSEFEKFLNEFKDNATYNKDFNVILLALSKIIDKGALERFFRNEGRMNDNVKALAIDSRKLRLYCLRISDQILILGNGGVKNTRTYQEDSKLSGYVMDLQTFDKVLLKAQKSGKVTIEKNMITDIQSATFEI